MAKSSPGVLDGKFRLDARPDRLDFRDRDYRPPLRSLPAQYPPDKLIKAFLPNYVEAGMVLDQGKEGACTGFGLAAVINYTQWEMWVASGREKATKPSPVSPWMLYNNARVYDEWDGEDYEGSSCRGAMKGWHKHGVCGLGLWPGIAERPGGGWDADAASRPLGAYYRVNAKSILDMQAAVNEVRAVYCSARVHSGWSSPRGVIKVAGIPLKTIRMSSTIVGGHAFAVVGYVERGFIVQNSWGVDWGTNGFALLTYEDWIKNGDDAWVAAFGAPMRLAESQGSPRGASRSQLNTQVAGNTLFTTKATDREDPTLPWPELRAYEHAIVMGNDGKLLRRVISTTDAADNLKLVLLEKPRQSGCSRIVLYAHGGLNDEDAAIRRARRMGPWFLANGIYPVFLVWRTGVLETLAGIGADEVREFAEKVEALRSELLGDLFNTAREKLQQAFDRAFEAIAQRFVGKAVWSQMKQNAEAAAAGQGGLAQCVKLLEELSGNTKIHLLGHSAGSILIGHMLSAGKDMKYGSCGLYAPACTSEFAARHFGPAFARGSLKGGKSFHVDILSDKAERADTVFAYGKSLLYLVSRALETTHKMPLLGLELAWSMKAAEEGFDLDGSRKKDVKAWLDLVGKMRIEFDVHSGPQVRTGLKTAPVKIAHGTFDNDLKVVNASIARILGQRAPDVRVTDLSGF